MHGMRSVWLLTLAIFIVFSGGVFWRMVHSHPPGFASVQIAGKTFRAERITSSVDQAKGLGGRNGLCSDCAMLFLFDKSDYYAFWMKDMRFPIDIIWIDGNRVVFIAHNVTPDATSTLTPPVAADKVLEVNAGTAEQFGISLGSFVHIR